MNSGRRIKLIISDDLLIGRKDNARGIFPDVDLGLDGGYVRAAHKQGWFEVIAHITMRLTVLQQQTKALQEEQPQTVAEVSSNWRA